MSHDLLPARAFLRGAIAIMPLSIAVLPWGLLAGSLAIEAGLSPLHGQGLSAIVFAGAAQLVAIGMLKGGAGFLSIMLTTLLLTSQHLLYGMSMRPVIADLPGRWRIGLGFLLTDEFFALTSQYDREAFNRWYALGVGLTFYIAWNLFTWWLGLPSSSSHALVGGYAGAAFAKAGIGALHMDGILKIVAFIAIAPLIGMVLGLINQIFMVWLVRNQPPVKLIPVFKKLQLVSSAIYSFAHGTNDAQKTMGIIFALLIASKIDGNLWGYDPNLPDYIPFWIEMLCYATIAAGTLFGGFRIVKTMGSKLTKLDPMHGFCAETGGGVTILGVSMLGIPASTTHTITGAIVGVGMAGGVRSVRWIVARRILWAWIFTIPISAVIGYSVYNLLILLGIAA